MPQNAGKVDGEGAAGPAR